MIKLTYIISDINKALAFEWIAEYINKEKFDLSFILLNPGPSLLQEYLFKKGLKVVTIKCQEKKDWPSALIKTYKLLKDIKPDIVHCHLLQANIIGLAAAKLAGIKSRIYTRHHSSLHHVYFKKGIFWDKLANRMATNIIAISPIVKKILLEWEKADPAKVILIPHGFDLESFSNVPAARVEAFIQRHQLAFQHPVIGVVSRFTEWKGIQYIIPAFANILVQYPSAVLILLGAKGDYGETLTRLLNQLPAERYRIIPFESDIVAAYPAMDVFVHVPIDNHSEAFGQIYIEALAAGIPSVFTHSGIANDPDFTNEIAYFVPHQSSAAIESALRSILTHKRDALCKAEAGKKVAGKFDLALFIKRLEALYAA